MKTSLKSQKKTCSLFYFILFLRGMKIDTLHPSHIFFTDILNATGFPQVPVRVRMSAQLSFSLKEAWPLCDGKFR